MKQRNMGGVGTLLMIGIILFAIPMASLLGIIQSSNPHPFLAVVMLAVGLFCLALVWFVYRANKKDYQAFYQRFPELNGSLEAVLPNADYVAKELGVLIYKGHLLNYKTGVFRFVDLKEVRAISYRFEFSRRTGGSGELNCQLVDGQIAVVSTIPITGQASQPILENLYSYIYSQDPKISFN